MSSDQDPVATSVAPTTPTANPEATHNAMALSARSRLFSSFSKIVPPRLSELSAVVVARVEQKVKEIRGDGTSSGAETLTLFPGWAVRRQNGALDGEVEVFVSGYATSQRPPDGISRSQKAVVKLAKSFAAAPKSAQDTAPAVASSTSAEELECEVQAAAARSTLSVYPPRSRSPSPATTPLSTPTTSAPKGTLEANLQLLHANIERRLQPFWSVPLATRTVSITVATVASLSSDHTVLALQDVITESDGSFQTRLTLPWGAVSGSLTSLEEHELRITAALVPLSSTPTPPPLEPAVLNLLKPPRPLSKSESDLIPRPRLRPPVSQPPSRSPEPKIPVIAPVPVIPQTLTIPITHSPIVRVISDVDDTIKHSGILSGARTAFHNVFARELAEAVIPGMSTWYQSMWQRGVRFHYVSNAPSELLPLLLEFLQISDLPLGSIKLRSYVGTRSFFNGLLSAPANRKRAGVLDVLTSFSESRFFLVGDSGEQDLELYAELAAEHPEQVLGVFIRDADPDAYEAIDDPTGTTPVALQERTPPRRLGFRSPSVPVTPQEVNVDALGLKVPGVVIEEPEDIDTDVDRSGGSSRVDHLTKPLAILMKKRRSTTAPEPLSPVSGTSPYGDTVASGSVEAMRGLSPSSSPSLSSSPPTTVEDGSHSPSTLSPSPQRYRLSEVERRRAEAERRRAALQVRVWDARAKIPDGVPLRVFRQPDECVEVNLLLEMEEQVRRRQEGRLRVNGH